MPIVQADDISGKTFDYIIVGTAGLVVAARLSEDPNVSVLVLEAGPANIDDALLCRPASIGATFGQEQYDWSFKTVPQTHSNNKEYFWFSGRTLGGSSAVNFFAWNKPPADHIDDLERLGNPGWNWANLQKYIARAEGFVPPTPEEIKEHELIGAENWKLREKGPIDLAIPKRFLSGDLDAVHTVLNAGIPRAAAPLAGLSFAPSTINPVTFSRSFATTGYWLPNQNRHNLSLIVNATATKIITEGESPSLEATGVQFVIKGANNVHKVVHAGKEVILSAGSIKTPHLLELSGIGDEKILDKVGIPVKIDLPGVGENVQEHCIISITFELRDDVSYEIFDVLPDPARAAKELKLYTSLPKIPWRSLPLTHTTLRKTSVRGPSLQFSWRAMLASEADLRTFVVDVKFIRKLPTLSPHKEVIVKEINPSPTVTTDEQIGDWIKNYMSTTFHTAGSASMPPKDKDGVVDPRLKVYGTSNLRVVDLSVVPLLFTAHSQSVVYELAKQAAAIIKGEI
ncbi:GMC oxidoreductase 10 [Heterobasidion irregulare TC 32-1]|uniref:GMC oxidoreductase 10 n=1 Tax=Heterobasidion irregulare (strain TC 32-1) TaxID=747525 RepID=W4JTN1_HETIT|nr:GMC oxidoreductase 10 [Heterobasidion irregulare TC 32-1]ETW76893.1 GMC oxidoreductase 10 [Heterobasidion irregulare TC 32-1]